MFDINLWRPLSETHSVSKETFTEDNEALYCPHSPLPLYAIKALSVQVAISIFLVPQGRTYMSEKTVGVPFYGQQLVSGVYRASKYSIEV